MALVNLSDRELEVLIMALETEKRGAARERSECVDENDTQAAGVYNEVIAELVVLRNKLREA